MFEVLALFYGLNSFYSKMKVKVNNLNKLELLRRFGRFGIQNGWGGCKKYQLSPGKENARPELCFHSIIIKSQIKKNTFLQGF